MSKNLIFNNLDKPNKKELIILSIVLALMIILPWPLAALVALTYIIGWINK